MKRFLLLLIVFLLVLFSGSPILADTSTGVVITATGVVVLGPQNFAIAYISDNEVELTWVKPEGAVNTLIRVKPGSYPVDRTDGYLVYYDDGESFTDTSVRLAAAEFPFYKAWSETAGGQWSSYSSEEEANFMSASFLFIGLILIAAFLTYFAYRVRLLIFTMAAASSWLGLGVWLLLSDSTNLQMGDLWTQIIATVFILMTIAVMTLQMRTDIRHERSVRGSGGGTRESWTESVPRRKKRQTSLERQVEYRELLRGKTGRRR